MTHLTNNMHVAYIGWINMNSFIFIKQLNAHNMYL